MDMIAFESILDPIIFRGIEKWLKHSGLLIYPTDTLYGIGGNYLDPKVHDAVDRVKGRNNLPYSMCVGGWPMLTSMTSNRPDQCRELYDTLMPGEFTFILEAANAIPKALLKGHATIGLRVPNLAPLLRLINETGIPLVTTSINRSGTPPLNDPQDIMRKFEGAPAILMDAGVLPPSKGSTILDLTTAPPRLVRKGDGYQRLVDLGITVTE